MNIILSKVDPSEIKIIVFFLTEILLGSQSIFSVRHGTSSLHRKSAGFLFGGLIILLSVNERFVC